MAATGGPPQSMSELEIAQLPRGQELDTIVGQKQAAIAFGSRATLMQQSTPGDVSITWELLQCRHPDWDLDYWTECRALYAGGKRLLGNADVMKRLFPSNSAEPSDIYKMRMARAYYFPYPGTIIDSLLAGLSSDPLRVAFGVVNEETGELEPPNGGDVEWWEGFVEDVTDEAYGADDEDNEGAGDDEGEEGGFSIHHFMGEVLRECMQTRIAWVRCDLPVPDPGAQIDSKLDEERLGIRDPRFCIVPAENVIDWEIDAKTKRLVWVLTLEKTRPRASVAVKRGKLEHHCYTMWTETDWVQWEIDIDPTNTPPPLASFKPTAGGEHPFGCVPFECFCLPEGLWAMGKMHSIAREHFNKRCAMSWAEFKALFAVLYEFLDDKGGSEIPTVGSPDRATEQLRAQGFTQLRSANDKAQFIGPDVAPFKEARESCNDAMREMHRVMFSMALSANMDKAALSRSGDSKEKDEASTKVLLAALGQIVRRGARCLLALASRGRGEPVPPAQVTGLEHFDVSGVSQVIADAVQLFSGIPIKSKLFSTLALLRVYRTWLGDTATDQQLQQIRQQIEATLVDEEAMEQAMQAATLATGDDGAKPGDGGDDDEEDAPPPKESAKPPSPIASRNRMKR